MKEFVGDVYSEILPTQGSHWVCRGSHLVCRGLHWLCVCRLGGGGVRIGCTTVFDTKMLLFSKGVICKSSMQMGLRCGRI